MIIGLSVNAYGPPIVGYAHLIVKADKMPTVCVGSVKKSIRK